jgi:hypothetical protein
MKTASVELNIEESGLLFHMLLRAMMEEEKSKFVRSDIFTDDVCAAIHRRQIILLKKLGAVNDAVRR